MTKSISESTLALSSYTSKPLYKETYNDRCEKYGNDIREEYNMEGGGSCIGTLILVTSRSNSYVIYVKTMINK